MNKALSEDTMLCYREARLLTFGLPIALVLAIYGRAWVLGHETSFALEAACFSVAAMLYALGEIRCEIIRSDIRRQRLEGGANH